MTQGPAAVSNLDSYLVHQPLELEIMHLSDRLAGGGEPLSQAFRVSRKMLCYLSSDIVEEGYR